MARSMTGFGRNVGEVEGAPVTVEISAVNHRFFEPSIRLPYAWNALEASLREQLKASVARGKVNVFIRRGQSTGGRASVGFDAEVAQQYIDAAQGLSKKMVSTEALSLNTLCRMDGVFFQEDGEPDMDKVAEALKAIFDPALAQFNAARETEGAALDEDVRTRLNEMAEALAVVEAKIPELSEAYETRLRERLADLNAEVGLKEERMALEVAMLADKTAVNEEVVRLKAHFARGEELLAKTEPIGRELNFLAQEIQREINTLGSKLRDIGVTREVIRMKSELEKLREQAQNIE